MSDFNAVMKGSWKYFLQKRYLYLLLLPGVVFFIVFNYVPMYGVIIAFKNFSFAKGILGSPWNGFENFKYLFGMGDFFRVVSNSVIVSVMRWLVTFPLPIFLAICINEIPWKGYKRVTQTLIYLPYFISWIVISGILINFLSPSWGVVNNILKQSFGIEPIFFLGEDKYFRAVVILTSVWKNTGWDTIIYLAAITAISPELYEAAIVDGANRFQRIIHVLLPGIRSTILVIMLLNIGNILNNGFEQMYALQNANNIRVSEVFETFTYRLGMVSGRFSFATTVGLFTGLLGTVLLMSANKIAKLLGEDGIF
jgi:putative aldouronate transport system permease protein